MSAASGLVIVDKPAGWTSHDVVARIRRLAATRRVGHAGTLDPMATGVLVVGVEKATRLLGYLALTDKEYEATVRLGQATDTGDAEGSVTSAAPAGEVTLAAVRAAAASLTGEIQQVPPAVSALKVGGRRAYELARAGKPPELAPRAVTVAAFEVASAERDGDLLDVAVSVTCSSGTYVRALGRDLGEALGVGGHLTRLRRSRSGLYDISQARTLDQLAEAAASPGGFSSLVMPMAVAAAAAFPCWHLTQEQARSLAFGSRLPGTGLPDGPAAALSPEGALVALVEEREGVIRPLAVFAGPTP